MLTGVGSDETCALMMPEDAAEAKQRGPTMRKQATDIARPEPENWLRCLGSAARSANGKHDLKDRVRAGTGQRPSGACRCRISCGASVLTEGMPAAAMYL
jgi:hypothetical protein